MRVVKKKKAAPAGAPRKIAAKPPTAAAPRPSAKAAPAPFDLAAVLAQATWKEADAALARVLRDFTALEADSQKLGRKLRSGEYAAGAAQVEERLLAVSQALRQAARKRNLHRFAEAGAIVAFDERMHELSKPAKRAPARVRILAQGVMRGLGPDAEVVLKAAVTPARERASGRRA